MTNIDFENKHDRHSDGKFAAKEGSMANIVLPMWHGSTRASELEAGQSFDLGYGSVNDDNEHIFRWVEEEGVVGQAAYVGPTERGHVYSVVLTRNSGQTLEVPDYYVENADESPTVINVIESMTWDAAEHDVDDGYIGEEESQRVAMRAAELRDFAGDKGYINLVYP